MIETMERGRPSALRSLNRHLRIRAEQLDLQARCLQFSEPDSLAMLKHKRASLEWLRLHRAYERGLHGSD